MGRASRKKRHRHERGVGAPADALGIAPRTTSRPTQPPRSPLSEALVQLIEPYCQEATNPYAYKALIRLGTLAWNMSSFSESEREKQLVETLREREFPDADALREIGQALSRGKEYLFPHDRRLIVDCNVTLGPDGYHVAVVSARPG